MTLSGSGHFQVTRTVKTRKMDQMNGLSGEEGCMP